MQMTAYSKVASALRERILTGAWDAGEQLPTERALCEQFRTSRITVRHALKILEDERLVQRRQGAGTFVSANPTRKIPLVNTDFFGSIEAHAPEMTRRVERWRTMAAPQEVADALQLLPGATVREAVRVDSLRGEPVATDHVFLVERFAHALTMGDVAEVDFVTRWESVHRIDIEYCTQTIEAVRAARPVTHLLSTRAGTPLLRETNVVFAAGGIPAGLFITWYRSDVFRLEATVDFRSRKRMAHPA